MNSFHRRQGGFTLVELLVSMAIAAIVMAAVYSSYASQQKAYVTQEQTAQMQQNLRAALYHLERDIRMAGYNFPETTGAGVLVATTAPPLFQFTRHENSDSDYGDDNENITYTIADSDGDGVVDRITRNGQAVAENIDALDFRYLDENGNITTNVNAIRSVQISIVARTPRMDPTHTDTTVYRNFLAQTIYTPSGNGVRFRRNMLRVEVKCRNLGM